MMGSFDWSETVEALKAIAPCALAYHEDKLGGLVVSGPVYHLIFGRDTREGSVEIFVSLSEEPFTVEALYLGVSNYRHVANLVWKDRQLRKVFKKNNASFDVGDSSKVAAYVRSIEPVLLFVFEKYICKHEVLGKSTRS